MRRLIAGILCLLATATAQYSHAEETALTVFAAASLTNALQAVGDAFTAETRIPVRFSFAASSTLAHQIEAGAPANVFVSADEEWMDYLQAHQRLAEGSRRDIVSNALVLIAPSDSRIRLTIAPGFALASALGADGRLSTADPSSVPAGKYAKAALSALGVWDSVKDRVVAGDNVRTALNFVARGEAPLGIVYRTDALSETKVRVVDVFPATSHERIAYPAAVTLPATPAAMRFVSFLTGNKAQSILRMAGFGGP